MTQFAQLLKLLVSHDVQFLIVGGIAAAVHGSARSTTDLDVVYSRERSNLEKLVTAIAPIKPYLRGAPVGLPWRWDLATLRKGLNFTLTTTLGDLDLLGEVAGGGSFKDLAAHSQSVEVFGSKCLCVDLNI